MPGRRFPVRPVRPHIPGPVKALGRAFGVPVTEVARYWLAERQALLRGAVALLIAAVADLAAGLFLGSAEGRLAELPGLLVLIPAAIAMRGATFGALGARIGTGIMTGEFQGELGAGTWLARQIRAVAVLTLVTSVEAALLAKLFAVIIGRPTVSIWDLTTISVVGGVLASLFLLAVTVGLARSAYRRGWNMDDVGAPVITATGDLVAIPALLAATILARRQLVTVTLAGVAITGTVVALVAGLRSQRPDVRRVVRESTAVLTFAAAVSILAGVVIQQREGVFLSVPALLILFPPFVAIFGSLGGMLSSRLTSKLHLGLMEPRVFPSKTAALDFSVTYLFSVAIYLLIGAATWALARALGIETPSLAALVGVSLVGGLLGTVLLSAVAYTAASATSRFGLDPDNHAIPIVTSVMDFLGILCLVAAMALFQIG